MPAELVNEQVMFWLTFLLCATPVASHFEFLNFTASKFQASGEAQLDNQPNRDCL